MLMKLRLDVRTTTRWCESGRCCPICSAYKIKRETHVAVTTDMKLFSIYGINTKQKSKKIVLEMIKDLV